MVYYVVIATLIFAGFYIKTNTERYIKMLLIILFLFTALHNPYLTGTDGIAYRTFFAKFVPTLPNMFRYDYKYEIGYALINSLAKTIRNDYFVFQILYCAISTVLLGIVLKKSGLQDNEKCLLLFVYFTFRYFQNSMEFLRQNIAILLMWIAVLNIKDLSNNDSGKGKYKYLFIIPAWSFHRSALFNVCIFPIVEWIKKIDKRKILFVTAVLSVVFLSFSAPVVNRIITMAVSIGGERYEKYFIETDTETVVRGINFINYTLRWVFTVIFSLGMERNKYEKKNTMLAISCVGILCGSINVEIFTRMLEYYMIGVYIAIAQSYKTFTKRSQGLYILILYMAFMIILIRNLHTVSGGTYMNYQLYPF